MYKLKRIAKEMNQQCENKDSRWFIEWTADNLFSRDGCATKSWGMCDQCKTSLKKLKEKREVPDLLKSLHRDIQELRSEVASLSSKLSRIDENAKISAEYAEYRSGLEDAKADFAVRQNT